LPGCHHDNTLCAQGAKVLKFFRVGAPEAKYAGRNGVGISADFFHLNTEFRRQRIELRTIDIEW